MSIELRHLRTFVILAEELHFGRAAARLHVVQSAVSQTLKALEDQLEVTLVTRSRRHVALSPAGERYLEHARRALAEIDEAGEQARRIASGRVGTLRVRFTATGALTVLPKRSAVFVDSLPRSRSRSHRPDPRSRSKRSARARPTSVSSCWPRPSTAWLARP